MCSDTAETKATVESRLMDLIGRGYQFIHPRDRDGGVVAVVGIRAHHTVVDVLRIDGEDDVTAFRIPGAEEDILNPRTILWRCRGEADEVLDHLLALPDSHAATGRQVSGCWVPGDTGRAKWLAAAS
ncbi:MAG TPA: hypothetical protein VJ870_01350 [Amycolatopsis sp.]|nr:hypothetical protein [Amycolatopsis sp.]